MFGARSRVVSQASDVINILKIVVLNGLKTTRRSTLEFCAAFRDETTNVSLFTS